MEECKLDCTRDLSCDFAFIKVGSYIVEISGGDKTVREKLMVQP